DQNDVRVLPQDRPQGVGECEIDLLVNLALNDAVDFIFDRVFGGDQLVADKIELVERGIKRRRLAGSGRSGAKNDAIGFVDQLAERVEDGRVHAQAIEIEIDHRAVEHADDDALAEHGGQNADAEVHLVAADVQFNAAVLRQAPLGNVEVGHDLDAAGDRALEVPRRRDQLHQHAVAAGADLVFFFKRLEVNVASPVADGREQDHVD